MIKQNSTTNSLEKAEELMEAHGLTDSEKTDVRNNVSTRLKDKAGLVEITDYAISVIKFGDK